jgi:hypothetical protein
LHPFDIKTVLFAKHAQHVVLIHFPIALFIIGVFFDFLAQWKKQSLLAAAAYYNLLVAAIATIPVVVTGILAWQWELEGQKLKGNPFDASGDGMRVKRPDLCGVVHPHENPTEPRRDPSGIPLADRGCCRSHRRTDGAPRRFSQRSEWTRINVFRKH